MYFLTYPDPPVHLVELPEKRTESTVFLEWKEPVFKGGYDSVTYAIFFLDLETETQYSLVNLELLNARV